MNPERLRRVVLAPPAFLGHRGAMLFWAGLTWIVHGFGIALGGWQPWPTVIGSPTGAGVWALTLRYAFVLWIVGGTIALTASFIRRRSVTADRLGYGAAVTIPVLTALLWLGKVTRLLVPEVWYGTVDGDLLVGSLVVTFLWIAAAGLFLTAAGWPDPKLPPLPIEPTSRSRHRARGKAR